MEHNELLELSRPWDCEQFPKIKNICFGGGGGAPSIQLPKVELPTPKVDLPEIKIPSNFNPIGDIGSAVTDIAGNIGSDLSQGIGDLGEQVKGGINHLGGQIEDTYKRSDLGQGLMGLQAGAEGLMSSVQNMLQGPTEQLASNLGGGGDKGGGGKAGSALGGVRGMDIAKRRAGMGRRQTMLTG